MLRSVGNKIEYLNKYRDNATKPLPETKDACFHIAHSLLLLLFAVIKFIRLEDVAYFSTGTFQL
jgi:hypothetical protein